jgi:pyrimidine operon attenuation protein/uracil phosphoribosyltransferase
MMMKRLFDAQELERTLDRLAGALSQEVVPGSELVLVGVRTRGVPLARRLAERLHKLQAVQPPVGILDITLYRDDLSQISRWPVLRGTEIPFAIDDRRVILVDDVLFTGRTVHAAMAAICDLGRPAVLRLAVLIDRGHREFPIQADYVGQVITTAPGDRINVRLRETDGTDEVILL